MAIKGEALNYSANGTDLAGYLGPGVGHVNSCRFVPDVNDADLAIDARIIDRHDLIAGKGKDRPDPCLAKRADEPFSAVHYQTSSIRNSRRSYHAYSFFFNINFLTFKFINLY